MGCVSSCTTNVSNNWKISVTVAIVSIALVILATQNLNMKHFEGIGHLGSNILLGLGAGIALLSFVIASCTKPANGKQLPGIDKEKGAAQQAVTDDELFGSSARKPGAAELAASQITIKIKAKKNGDTYQFSDSRDQWKVAYTLTGNEVLLSEVDGITSVHYIGERGINVDTTDIGIRQILNEIAQKERQHISKNKVEKALNIEIPAVETLSEAEQERYKSVLLQDEHIEFQQGTQTVYLTNEGVKPERSGTICERQPALLELRIQKQDKS